MTTDTTDIQSEPRSNFEDLMRAIYTQKLQHATEIKKWKWNTSSIGK